MTELDQNKLTVQRFLDMAFNDKKPAEAFAAFVGPTYIQHNPHAPHGREASLEFLSGFMARFPQLTLDIKRAIAEGHLVVTHSLMKLSPEDRGVAVADIVRIQDGKIVEHWDVAQEVPEAPANDNTMF
ncbi:nuclear transport factor 2 family protein [Nonomuraea sp. NPDC049400]|uniref:nuclear transport factor 2 family protein n=1 Tax=Nonomuraea sp. NPDC049400 TaxID=3364352 RepID=UPI00379C9D6D